MFARSELFTENTLEPIIPLRHRRDLTFFHAIFAGWLIALLAWLLASTRDTMPQIVLVWLTTAPIAALGFRHSIAGAVEAFYRVAAGSAPANEMLSSFILPAVPGNTVDGGVLVALLNYGQVKSERERGSHPGAPLIRVL